MKDDIKKKLDAHIQKILDKHEISNEEYALLEHKLSTLPADNCWNDFNATAALLMLVSLFCFGGERE